jgi:hypothetical protein
MKTGKGKAPDFIYSSDLFAAANRLGGRGDSVSLGRAMRSPELRKLIRNEQYKIAMLEKQDMQKKEPSPGLCSTGPGEGHEDLPKGNRGDLDGGT